MNTDQRDFNFMEYLLSMEKMMEAWHQHSGATLRHPTNLGGAREHFVRDVLLRFLPSTILVGSGEITDGMTRSAQQDVILYRSDFPVISGFDYVNLYMIEGVIATIEVKSDLSTGDPNGLTTALKNQRSVLELKNQALLLKGDDNAWRELQKIHTVATYVVGYRGWTKKDAFLHAFQTAASQVRLQVPDIVYSPQGSIVLNTELAKLQTADGTPVESGEIPSFGYCPEYGFPVFVQILLRRIMQRLGNLTASHPGLDALMQYPMNSYFSLPRIACEHFKLEPSTDSR